MAHGSLTAGMPSSPGQGGAAVVPTTFAVCRCTLPDAEQGTLAYALLSSRLGITTVVLAGLLVGALCTASVFA